MRALRCQAALLLAVLLPPGAQAAGVTKAPEAPAVLAWALIPDLDRTLGHVEAAAAVFNPGAMAPGMMKGMLGAQLGDPELAGLAPGPIMAVMLPGKDGSPQFALFLPVTAKAPYAATFAKQGMKTKAEKGLLAVAPTQEALDAAWGAQATYRALAKGPAVAHDLRLEFQADRLVAAYGPVLEMGFASMMAAKPTQEPGAPDTAQAQRILALELKALLAVFTSSETMRWDLDVDAAALTSGTLLKFKPGTSLAVLSSMPVSGPNPARGLISDSGLMSSEWRADPKKVSAFLVQLLDEMAKDPATAEFATADMRALVADVGRCATGDAAFSIRPSGAWGSAETAMTVADEAACLAMMEKGIHLAMGPDSFAQKTYQGMGMNLSVGLQRKARVHGGVAVHRLKTTMKSATADKPAKGKPAPKPSPDPFSNPMMAAMMRDTEFAFSHGYYVSSQDPARLDKLIDLAAAGPAPPASSGTDLLPNANMVVSYDFVALMKATMANMPEPGMASAFANLPPAEPVRFAMTMSQGQMEGRGRMPLAPFAAMAAMAASAKAAALAPAPAPSPSPRPPVKKKP